MAGGASNGEWARKWLVGRRLARRINTNAGQFRGPIWIGWFGAGRQSIEKCCRRGSGRDAAQLRLLVSVKRFTGGGRFALRPSFSSLTQIEENIDA